MTEDNYNSVVKEGDVVKIFRGNIVRKGYVVSMGTCGGARIRVTGLGSVYYGIENFRSGTVKVVLQDV